MGSINEAKVRGARKALALVGVKEVIAMEVDTGLPRQPVGLASVALGAAERAYKVYRAKSADFSVGIEAGLVPYPSPGGYLELQVAVVVDDSGRCSLGISPSFPLPKDVVEEVLLGGKELAEVAERLSGITGIGRNVGVIGWLTAGRVTRADLSFLATLMAALPWIRKELRWDLPTIDELREQIRKQIF